MKTLIAALLLALIVSNGAWWAKYHELDLDDMQSNAMLDWANDYMHDMSQHQTRLEGVCDSRTQ